jgi:amyloid beta precursor protein binding protein 1
MASTRVATPPPLRDLPTAKEKKYDRQLRLWGASGQAALEETHILLVNNGSGIGQFSILDPAIVKEADLGVNFFLEDESLGKFRAEETVRLLEELNPDAKGTAIKEVSRNRQCLLCYATDY